MSAYFLSIVITFSSIFKNASDRGAVMQIEVCGKIFV
jgi:hypothetical protein